MKNYVANLKSKDFRALLDDFASCTTSYFDSKYKYYEKMDWGDWKQIQRDFTGKCVTISFDTWNVEVCLDTNDGHHMCFNTADGAWGSFLFDKYAHQLEDMHVKCCDYDSSEKRVTDERKNFPYEPLLKADVENKKKENKENKEMKGFNFDFGPCTNDNVRMSMYGLAIQNNAGVWVSYNNGQVIDVDVMNFDGRQYMFKMPVAIKDIKVGDAVIHNRVPMFVTSVEGGVHVVDIRAGEAKTIVPTTNMFGFNFITKIVSMFDAFGAAPTADQPFGNMLPFMLMGDNKDIDPMMMFMMMNQDKDGFDMSNPMMLYFMFGKDGTKSNDMLPLMMMMNNCGCHCGGHHND